MAVAGEEETKGLLALHIQQTSHWREGEIFYNIILKGIFNNTGTQGFFTENMYSPNVQAYKGTYIDFRKSLPWFR